MNWLYILGIRLSPDSEGPEVYTLVVSEERDRAVVNDGALLFVTDHRDIPLLYRFLDVETQSRYPLSKATDENIDMALALHLLENKEIDEGAAILEFLNGMFDLLSSLQIVLPAEIRKNLYGIADFLTFKDNFGDYLREQSILRERILDDLMWCIGTIFSLSRIPEGGLHYRDQGENSPLLNDAK